MFVDIRNVTNNLKSAKNLARGAPHSLFFTEKIEVHITEQKCIKFPVKNLAKNLARGAPWILFFIRVRVFGKGLGSREVSGKHWEFMHVREKLNETFKRNENYF